MSHPDLPTGLVTFVLTDVVSSTSRWKADRHAASSDMSRLDGILSGQVSEANGIRPLVQGEGDSAVAVFVDPLDALTAAHRIQVEVGRSAWDGGPLDVRIGVHTGRAHLVDNMTYGGPSIIRAARLRDTARGRQVVVSASTMATASDELAPGYGLKSLGEVTLRGWDQPEQIYQLTHPDLAAAFPSPIRPWTPPAIPTFATRLVGRRAAVNELAALIGSQPVATITGAAGCGKTRLAAAVSEQLEPDFEAVTWVDLARVADPAEVSAKTVSSCGLSPRTGDDPVELLRQHLTQAVSLVVLDNCEHVLTAVADLVESIANPDSGSRILLTSREPLGVPGETVWRAPSLDPPPGDAETAAALTESSAVELLVDRAKEADPAFAVTEANAGAVAAVCRRLDGVPLALELAAARLRTMHVDELAGRLDERFRLLTAGSRVALERQRTLLASVEWSHDLLDRRERAVFRRLSIFLAPFTLEAVEEVCSADPVGRGDVLELLTSLVEKSLVQRASRGRYELLETMRAFGLEQAASCEELGDLRDRHLRWALGKVDGWGLQAASASHSTVAEIGEVAPDLISAARWASHEDPSSVEPLVYALTCMWGARSAFAEGDAVMTPLLEDLGVGTAVWLAALSPVMTIFQVNGNLGWLQAAAEAHARHSETLPDRVSARVDSFKPSVQLYDASPGAPEAVRAKMKRLHDAGDHGGAAISAALLAFQLAGHGYYNQAREDLSWLGRNAVRGAVEQTYTDLALALLADSEGDFPRAREILLSHLGEEPDLAGAMITSFIARHANDQDLAARAKRVVDDQSLIGMFRNLAPIARATEQIFHDDPAAGESLDEAALLPSVAVTRASVLRLSAVHALGFGDYGKTRTRLVELREFLEHRDIPRCQIDVDICEAWLTWFEGDTDRAVDLAHQALNRAEEVGYSLGCIDALEALGIFYAETDPSTAARLVGLTGAFHDQTGYRQEKHAGLSVDDARELLPVDLVAEGAQLGVEDGIALVRGNRGPRARPEFGWESLTPAEERVVDLVAEGLTNAQIAEKLVVSVATVKTHLVHSYRKLAIGSRTELAVAVAERSRGD